MDESKFDEFDTAKTVYSGAGKAGLAYRFYDKEKEVCSKHNKTLDEVEFIFLRRKMIPLRSTCACVMTINWR